MTERAGCFIKVVVFWAIFSTVAMCGFFPKAMGAWSYFGYTMNPFGMAMAWIQAATMYEGTEVCVPLIGICVGFGIAFWVAKKI